MKLLRRCLAGFLLLVLLIALPSFIILGSADPEGEVELYLLSNDVHVGLVMPMKNEILDWSEFIDLNDFEATGEWFQIGWGDRTFYFEVPEWEDLTLFKAIDALLLPGEPAIHIDFLQTHPRMYEALAVKMSREKYLSLAREIKSRFKLKDSRPVLIPSKAYGSSDNFYEAQGTYSLIRTCNNWTAELLGSQGLRRPLWSPMKYGLLYTYQ